MNNVQKLRLKKKQQSILQILTSLSESLSQVRDRALVNITKNTVSINEEPIKSADPG